MKGQLAEKLWKVPLCQMLLRRFSQFVPEHLPPSIEDLRQFRSYLTDFDKILVLTGAGISTESGIPDYRSREVGAFDRTSYRPIQYSEFIKNSEARKKYWARNFVGWKRFSTIFPNEAHLFITGLQNFTRKVVGIVTQNIDGLHSKAGSDNVIELHGNAFWIRCEKCGYTFPRYDFQSVLEKHNPFMEMSESSLLPDGDVELNVEDVENFIVPPCEKCGGILKPTVVFFGENVPIGRIKKVEKLVEECDSMLILGTSLSTLSSYRIVQQAFDMNKYLCLVNIGPTRADKIVNLRINAKISDIIPRTD